MRCRTCGRVTVSSLCTVTVVLLHSAQLDLWIQKNASCIRGLCIWLALCQSIREIGAERARQNYIILSTISSLVYPRIYGHPLATYSNTPSDKARRRADCVFRESLNLLFRIAALSFTTFHQDCLEPTVVGHSTSDLAFRVYRVPGYPFDRLRRS